MIALSDYTPLNPEEYLKLEKQSPIKHEYIDGEVYAMALTTDTHNTIALNIATLIRNHLRGKDCRVYFADIKARIEEKNCFYYPDILVTCDPQDRDTPTYKSFPKLIIEVLSEGTEAFDRGDQFSDYQTIKSLQEYVLVNSKHQRIEVFRRQNHNNWQFTTYNNENSIFILESINLELTMNDIYENTNIR